MRIYKIIIFLSLFGIIIIFNQISASHWNLPGIDIISRQEWGADETRRHQKRPEFQEMVADYKKKQKDLALLREEDFDAYLKIKEKEYQKKMANNYLTDNFGDEYSYDEIHEENHGQELWTSEYIKDKKTKIIIHHTATSYKNLTNKDTVLKYLQKTYKFHVFTKARGDIGYNFLIDPQGNIYEGRAGGEGTVGMHTKWNNTPSIGIALMGNFQIQEPTDKQLNSLIKLSTALSIKYNINPTNKTYYHRDSKSVPYLESNKNYTIAGHRDAGYTACPGKNLYNKFPYIREQVNKRLLRADLIKNKRTKIKIPNVFYSNKKNITLTTPLHFNKLKKCTSKDKSIEITSCTLKNEILTIHIQKKSGQSSGIKHILLKNTTGESKEIIVVLLWQNDLNPIISQFKRKYLQGFTLLSSLIKKNKILNKNKIKHKISIFETKQLLQQKIQVLLYSLSLDYNSRDINCDGECIITADDKIYHNKKIHVGTNNTTLLFTLDDDTAIYTKNLNISSSNNGLVYVDNYTRTSYKGIPWNVFRGMISFQKDLILTNKKQNIFDTQYVVINTLDFDDYLKGIVESNDQDSEAKNEVMSLVSKNYALFYMHTDNIHPNIPNNAKYNAIDDPDLFQKYVGAGLENTLHKRYKALDKTKKQLITYKGYIPILPYFHCSPGFTFTAQEKRGWNDTPYLQSRLDLGKCKNFEGHGVGMSGKGAEWRAKHGFNAEQIIKYYYAGIEITPL